MALTKYLIKLNYSLQTEVTLSSPALTIRMSLPKILLYPFSIKSPYFEGYSWAVTLALRMKAKLKLFTTTFASVPSSSDSIYHSLLEANGYYLEHYRDDHLKSSELNREPCIVNGELEDELIFHLKKNPVDIVIIDQYFSAAHRTGMKEIMKESGAVIILSESQPGRKDPPYPVTDYFYDRLRCAELYKLPENFFITLSNDHSVFNYLRNFIQKNSSLN